MLLYVFQGAEARRARGLNAALKRRSYTSQIDISRTASQATELAAQNDFGME